MVNGVPFGEMILRVTLNGEVKYNGAEGKPSLNRAI